MTDKNVGQTALDGKRLTIGITQNRHGTWMYTLHLDGAFVRQTRHETMSELSKSHMMLMHKMGVE